MRWKQAPDHDSVRAREASENSLMPVAHTAAPSFANAIAVARLMPCPAAVTKAVLPASPALMDIICRQAQKSRRRNYRLTLTATVRKTSEPIQAAQALPAQFHWSRSSQCESVAVLRKSHRGPRWSQIALAIEK